MKRFLRVLMTVVLIGWLLTQVDLRSLGPTFAAANPFWLTACLVIGFLTVFVATLRWQVLLRPLGIVRSHLSLLRIVLVGAFFSMFLPSSVGGDVMRIVLLAPSLDRREDAVSTVLLDRVIGMVVTVTMGFGALLMLPGVWGNSAVVLALVVSALASVFGITILFSRRLLALVEQFVPGPIWRRIGPALLRINASLHVIGGKRRVLLAAAGFAAIRQLMICGAAACAGLALGLTAGPAAYFVMVPIGLGVTVLPIAINGIGLQDNVLVVLLGSIGIGAVHALAISLLLHLSRNLIGLAGGVVFAVSRRPVNEQALPADGR